VTLAPANGSGWRGRIDLASELVRGRPALVAGCASAEFAARVKVLTESWRPDVVQLELEEMAQYASSVTTGARVLTIHDPGVATARQLRATSGGSLRTRAFRALDGWAWARYEPAALSAVEAVVTLTHRDRSALAGSPVAASVIPLGVDLPEVVADPDGDGRAIVFIGGFRHPPNVDGALRLATSIFPLVRDRAPDAVLELVGAAPPDALLRARGDAVRVTGAVDDVRPYLDRAAVIALPLRIGGGMRVKTLEALAAGKAIVASPVALAGLDVVDGKHVFVAEQDHEFAERILRLLGDPALRRRLGKGARQFAIENLDWQERVRQYEELYARLVRSG
jgi:glycosyltransferase involved in cell wall biosynthesis